jgi:tetratricopeptide (TPR) repeat protein
LNIMKTFWFRRLASNGLRFSCQNPTLPIFFFLLFLFVEIISASNTFAGDDFLDQYKAYRGYVESGSSFLRKGDYPQTIANFSKAIEKSPFEVSHYYNRGIASFRSGKRKEAEEDFEKVIILDSKINTAYIYRGLCREGLGKFKEALSDYKAALDFKPDDANIHNNLAWLYATAGDEQVRDKVKALEHAKKAADLSREKNAEILDTLAHAYFVNGKIDEAIETENKAVKAEPNSKKYQDNLKLYGQGKGQ